MELILLTILNGQYSTVFLHFSNELPFGSNQSARPIEWSRAVNDLMVIAEIPRYIRSKTQNRRRTISYLFYDGT